MTTLTVNIGDKKSEKAVKAVLDALGLPYSTESAPDASAKILNQEEKKVHKTLQGSLKEIKQHQQGKIDLRDARELLNEL